MDKYLKGILFILQALAMAVFLSTCIDPYPYTTPESLRILTVDGLISTAPGPHEIRLTYANQYSNTLHGNRIVVAGAKVSIIENGEVETPLTEEILLDRWWCSLDGWILLSASRPVGVYQQTGRYLTPEGFCAKIGSSYELRILTADGKAFKSDPVTVVPVAPIKNVEIQHYNSGTENPLIDSKGVQFLVSFSDPENQQDFYYWRLSKSHIELITEPYLMAFGGNPPSCCDLCYMPDMEAPAMFAVMNDDSFDGLATTQSTIRILNDGIRFKSRYRVQLDQYAISQEAHHFLRLIRQQLDIHGSVFDPPPANIRGNIRNTENPEEQVLGLFIAADVSSKMIYINRDDIPPSDRAVRSVIPGDCRQYCGRLIEPPTSKPPGDWEYN